jgi:predicted aspartyl protease
MADYTLNFSEKDLRENGPRIQVRIGHSEMEYAQSRLFGVELPEPLVVKGLIDTGASITVINPKVAESRQLRQTGFTILSAAGSQAKYPEYVASMSFPGSGLRGFDLIRVVACQLPSQPIACLLGRDILRRWLLTYNGKSATVSISEP